MLLHGSKQTLPLVSFVNIEYDRVDLPVLIVHCVRGEPPDILVSYDGGEAKSESRFQVSKSKTYNWEKVESKIFRLNCLVRRTANSMKALTEEEGRQYAGPQFFFPQKVDWKTTNPGENFEYPEGAEEEPLFFDGTLWQDRVGPKVLKALRETDKNWDDLHRMSVEEYLETILPLAVKDFFEFYEDDGDDYDVSSAEAKRAVTEGLRKTFTAFKKEHDAKEEEFVRFQEAGGAIHYKIYPENDVIQEYLETDYSKEAGRYKSITTIGPWSKAAEVFPPKLKLDRA